MPDRLEPSSPPKTTGVKDLVSGLVLVVVGIGLAKYSAANHDIGTLRRMGSGAFPMGLGIVLAGLGAAVAISARGAARRIATDITLPRRPLVAILAALAVFALVIERFGLVPATVAMLVVGDLAAGPVAVLRSVRVGLLMAGVGYLVFVLALGLPISLIEVPW